MRATLIHEGEAYAYAPDTGFRGPADHYLRAVVLAAPKAGKVLVRIEHPDEHVADVEREIKTRGVAGAWDAPPPELSEYRTDDRPEHEQPAPPEGRDRLPYHDRAKLTFAEHAAVQYAKVVEQRELVARLAELGIERRRAHYGGQGGQDRSYRADGYTGSTAVNQFTRDELRHLLDLAEVGRAEIDHELVERAAGVQT